MTERKGTFKNDVINIWMYLSFFLSLLCNIIFFPDLYPTKNMDNGYTKIKIQTWAELIWIWVLTSEHCNKKISNRSLYCP